MTINNNHRTQSGGILSIFRRGSQWQEIEGYRVEDLNSDRPVLVTAGSTMLGNIIAPQIKVAGMVNGATVAQTTIVTGDGEIWGDVYTAQLQIDSGGIIYGWISSIDNAKFQQIQEQGSAPSSLTEPESAIDRPGFALREQSQMDAFSRLRTEAANAKAARSELEQTFDRRLSEVAGEATARVVSLREELVATHSDLTTAQQKLNEVEQTLLARQVQIERYTEELTTTRTLLEERNRALHTLQQLHEEKSEAFAQLQTAKDELDTHFHGAQQEIDDLNKKLDNLESALQDNIQHSLDQEASLVRWQELAEDYKKQIDELKNKLRGSDEQIGQQSTLIDMLRSQRDQLEIEWEKAQDELNMLRHRETQPLKDVVLADGRPLLAAYEEAQAEVAQLQSAVSQLSHYEAQVAWYQADLETARTELQETRAVVGKQETRLTQLQDKLQTTQEEVQEREQQIEQLKQQFEERLADQMRHAQAMEQRLNQTQDRVEESQAEKETIKKSVRQYQLQLEATEMELERHIEETQTQGQRLAEIQTTLVEREIKMAELKKAAVTRSQTLAQLKNAASQRIQKLEKQLAHSQQRLAHSQEQIKELKAFIERRHKT